MDNTFFDNFITTISDYYFQNFDFNDELYVDKYFHSIWKDKKTRFKNTKAFNIHKNTITIIAEGWKQETQILGRNGLSYSYNKEDDLFDIMGYLFYVSNENDIELFNATISVFFDKLNKNLDQYDKDLFEMSNLELANINAYSDLIIQVIEEIPEIVFLDLSNYKALLYGLYDIFRLPLNMFSIHEQKILQDIENDEKIKKIDISEHLEKICRLFKYIYDKESSRNMISLSIAYIRIFKSLVVNFFANRWITLYGELESPYIKNYFMIDDISHLQIIPAHMLLNYLLFNNVYKNKSFLDVYDEFVSELLSENEEAKQLSFVKKLKKSKDTSRKSITIDDVDLMTGTEFESFIAKLFTKYGYSCIVTKQSGDQGIDIIAEKNAIKIGIQAKCFSNTVGNSAIQEAVAGKAFYNCDKVMVITNNNFTAAAQELANINNVILWGRNILKEKLDKYNE